MNYSILRAGEDAEVARLDLRGRVIDLGGHKGSSYFKLLQTGQPVEVVNLDTEHPGTHKTPSGADHSFDLEKPFPLPNEMYDAVISLNVLEHLYNYQNLLHESFRILKKEGTIHLSVPFFFNIHGSPDDYFRYTKSALVRMLTDAGFRDVMVSEIGEGPCTAVFQNFGGSVPTVFLRVCCKYLAIHTDVFFSKLSKRYASIKNRVPLGYFVSAKKQ